HADASEWQAVIAVSEELTALGLKSADVDRAAKAARQHIRREKAASHDESGPPRQHGGTGRIAEGADHRLHRAEPAERASTEHASTGKPQAEPRSAGLDWRIFYASHFPALGSIAIVVPLLILAAATSRIIIYTQLTPLGVMAVLGLAGIAGSA